MRSYHYHLAALLTRIALIENVKCNCNKYDKNLNDGIFHCKLYKDKEHKRIENLCKFQFLLPLNIESLISGTNIEACKYIS